MTLIAEITAATALIGYWDDDVCLFLSLFLACSISTGEPQIPVYYTSLCHHISRESYWDPVRFHHPLYFHINLRARFFGRCMWHILRQRIGVNDTVTAEIFFSAIKSVQMHFHQSSS